MLVWCVVGFFLISCSGIYCIAPNLQITLKAFNLLFSCVVKIFSKFLLYLQQTPGLKLNENNLPYNKLKTPNGYFSSCVCIRINSTSGYSKSYKNKENCSALLSPHNFYIICTLSAN